MKKQSKKTLAFCLAILLIFGLFPTAVFAAEGDDPAISNPAPVETDGATPTSLPEPTPGPGATPAPTETPLPTPTPVDVTALTGDKLYQYLVTLGESELHGVLNLLTEEQTASLKPFVTAEVFYTWFPEAISNLAGQELYDELLTIYTTSEELFYGSMLPQLTQAQIDSLSSYLTVEQAFVWFNIKNWEPTEPHAPNNTYAGDFMPPVVAMAKAAGMLRSLGNPTALVQGQESPPVDNDGDGIAMSKSVSLTDETYKIKMELFTTGVVTESAAPTDFVLVLDQSTSMSTYTDFPGTNYSQITGTSRRNSNLSTLAGQYNLFKLDGGTYYPVSVSRNNSIYTYTYTVNGTTQTATSTGGNTEFSEWTLHTATLIKRIAALKIAANAFAQKVGQNATATLNHRIAVVGFGSQNAGTGLYIGSTMYTYGNISTARYQGAFQDMSTTGGRNNVSASINALLDGGGARYTRSDLGMELGKNVLSNNPVQGPARNRVVILFTDGVPTMENQSDANQLNTTVAGNAITQSYAIKNTYNATVYTIGVFADAQPSDMSNNVNRYMNHVSSNFPQATSLSGSFAGSTGNGYYLTAGNQDGLNSAFGNIADKTTTPTIPLGSVAVVRDFITPYYAMPTGLNKIVTKTAAKRSDGTFADPVVVTGLTVNIDPATRCVSVTGYNFDANCITNTPKADGSYGKMLIIEIDVTRAPGFIGGNDVPTNTDASGLYQTGSAAQALENFVVPVANVPILYHSFNTQDKNIYAGDDVTLNDLFSGVYTTAETGGDDYMLGDFVTNEYADVSYAIYNSATLLGTYVVDAGEPLTDGSWTVAGFSGKYEDVLADTAITIKATITPADPDPSTNIGEAGMVQDLTGTADINVFKPSITPKDLSVHLTQNPTAGQLSTIAQTAYTVAWLHGEQTDEEAGLSGAPALAYTYTNIPATYSEEDCDITLNSVTRTDNSLNITSVSTLNKTSNATADKSLRLFILKPTVVCSDFSVFLGWQTNLPYRYSNVTWAGTAQAPQVAAPFLEAPVVTRAPVLVSGTAPGTDLTVYAPLVTSTFKVKTQIGSKDITEHTGFKNGTNDVTTAAQHFTITVVTGTLTITKDVTDALLGESFLFSIGVDTNNNGTPEYTFHEVIQGNGSKDITGLPAGTYTVTEDTSWSWRYEDEPDYTWDGGDTKLGETIDDTKIKCTVENSTRVPYWVSGENNALNTFNTYSPTV